MIQNLATRLQRLLVNNQSIVGALNNVSSIQQKQCTQRDFHTSMSIRKSDHPTHFLSYNDKMYPIQGLDEERRPAYVCHQKCDIRYPPKKMLYVSWLVRGMTIDEALKQLSFCVKKGAAIAKETLLEAQKIAVEKHNVEFKSNLWVAESFCTKAFVIKGLRRHAKGRKGEIRYTFSHYFVRLEEGSPPKDYYKNAPKSPEELLENWKNKMRMRKVHHSL